ncbi:septal ring lytic transglycosylase RlpA family protein [Verrucomicrobiales bacterium BCK34]|nr:septal ring lytic transglycosylase RlpA family protein [Verrucomicrobiales bacterium BCK34]
MTRLLLFGLAASLLLLLPSCESIGIPGEEVSVPGQVEEVVPHIFPGLRKTGQVHEGKMSWYSVRTNGGTKTASGERLRDSGNTAAHRTLPMGTLVKVTNLNNDRSAIVRINDRGPYSHGRIVDVSIGVAGKLDFVKNGVAPCRVEVMETF